jgi:hypothetical protein
MRDRRKRRRRGSRSAHAEGKESNRRQQTGNGRRRGEAHSGGSDGRRSGYRDARAEVEESGSRAMRDPLVGASFYVRWMAGDILRSRITQGNYYIVEIKESAMNNVFSLWNIKDKNLTSHTKCRELKQLGM